LLALEREGKGICQELPSFSKKLINKYSKGNYMTIILTVLISLWILMAIMWTLTKIAAKDSKFMNWWRNI